MKKFLIALSVLALLAAIPVQSAHAATLDDLKENQKMGGLG